MSAAADEGQIEPISSGFGLRPTSPAATMIVLAVP